MMLFLLGYSLFMCVCVCVCVCVKIHKKFLLQLVFIHFMVNLKFKYVKFKL